MPVKTRDFLINTAEKHFYCDGFRNVGLEQIISEVGISKTAFYKHFACKEDLMLEVLERQNLRLQEMFMQLLREHAGRSAENQLLSVFDVVNMIIQSEEFRGCIFVNAAIEFPLPHDPVYKAAARNKQSIEQMIFDIAERAQASNPQALAEELCMIIEGAYITRIVSRNPKTIDIARRLGVRTVETYLNKKKAKPTKAPRKVRA